MRISRSIGQGLAVVTTMTAVVTMTGGSALANQVERSIDAPRAVVEYRIVSALNGGRLGPFDNMTGDVDAVANRNYKIGEDWPGYKWRFELRSGSDNFVIKNSGSGACLQPKDKKFELGTQVVVRSCDGSSAQEWKVTQIRTPAGATVAQIAPASAPNMVLTLQYPGNDSYSNVQLNRHFEPLDPLDRQWLLDPEA